MKPWPSTDRAGHSGRSDGEYLGRTAEEALAKAAAALGPSAELRCWKTRRGGVGGFFATEVYVAGSKPPPGAEGGRNRPRRKPTDGTSRARATQAGPTRATGDVLSDLAEAAGDPLTVLAENTTDRVSLPTEVLPAAFDALLAEAQAALDQDPTLPAGAPDVAATADGFLPASPDEPTAGLTGASGAEGIPNLRARLRALCVPDAYLPAGERPTLDALAGAMGTLPPAPIIGADPGQIVLVVGAEDLAERTADVLVEPLALRRRDVVRCALPGHGGPDDAEDPDEDADARMTAVKVGVNVRVAKRRANGAPSLVAVSTSPDEPGARAAADLIDCVRPHSVLVAVDAAVKRVDAERWLQALGRTDALALWGLEGTRTPGELLGTAPIAYAEGTACTALSWTATLLARLAGEDRS
jgi:hypothetical protein